MKKIVDAVKQMTRWPIVQKIYNFVSDVAAGYFVIKNLVALYEEIKKDVDTVRRAIAERVFK